MKYTTYVSFMLMGIYVVLYFVGFRGINKLKLKVYSQNSDINYILNKEEKYLNSVVWFRISLTASIVYIFTYLLLYEVINVGYTFTIRVSLIFL